MFQKLYSPTDRYVVIKKLGWGHFSTVWMVKDRKSDPANECAGDSKYQASYRFLAMKVQKSAEHYTEAALDEVELLDSVAQERRAAEHLLANNPFQKQPKDADGITVSMNLDHAHHVATFRDSFFHSGPNGKHMCMVFNMLGCNLLSVIKAYNYQGIPIPVVKNMVRGVCKGLDFLHRKCKIIHTDLKPENVLLQFANPTAQVVVPDNTICIEDGDETHDSAACESKIAMHEDEFIESQWVQKLRDPNVSMVEKLRIQKKLDLIRPDAKQTLNDEPASKLSSESNRQEINGVSSPMVRNVLTDSEMDRIVSEDQDVSGSKRLTSSSLRNKSTSLVYGTTPPYIIKQFNKSRFVAQNFSAHQDSNPTQWEYFFQQLVSVTSPSKAEVDEHLSSYGIAEISFALRAFVTEGELADSISSCLGCPYERNDGKIMRTWRCAINLKRNSNASNAGSSASWCTTMFEIFQYSRKTLGAAERRAREELIYLAGCNFSPESAHLRRRGNTVSTPASCPPYSLFSLKCSVLSTVVVLGFLESRLPGLCFLAYSRDDGSPRLDPIVFGEFGSKICNHPLTNKSLEEEEDIPMSSESKPSSSLIGLDLRLIKSFAARPEPGTDGSACFELSGSSMEIVRQWWFARNPLLARVRMFMKIDPISDLLSPAVRLNTSEEKENAKDEMAPSNDIEDAASFLKNPDLKDYETLRNARAVIVDLGNACWTHRHFSEDIQTRQYRSPEVLIGSKYVKKRISLEFLFVFTTLSKICVTLSFAHPLWNRYDTSADIWSLGCMVFELLTGDLLFDPRSGEDYDRDEDHLAMFQELLGKMPKKMALSGKHSKRFFSKKGDLLHIQQLKFWPIEDVLHEKYRFQRKDAQNIAKFMLPLLEFNPKRRATALECLHSEWLKET